VAEDTRATFRWCDEAEAAVIVPLGNLSLESHQVRLVELSRDYCVFGDDVPDRLYEEETGEWLNRYFPRDPRGPVG